MTGPFIEAIPVLVPYTLTKVKQTALVLQLESLTKVFYKRQ